MTRTSPSRRRTLRSCASTTASSTRCPRSVPQNQRFARAREIVTKHYQWMLRTDYLPRICAPGIVNNVFSSGRKVFEVGAAPTDVPTMPIEFSVAAFRLGHSMIREAYNWNRVFDDGFGDLFLLFEFTAGSGSRRRANAAEQLDRRLPAALRLQGGWAERPRGARAQVQPGDAHRHDPHAHAPVRPRLRLLRGQPRVPKPDAGEDGAARDRPADGHVHEEQGREPHEAHERPDPRRQERRRPRGADPAAARRRSSRTPRSGSTSCARPSSTRAS